MRLVPRSTSFYLSICAFLACSSATYAQRHIIPGQAVVVPESTEHRAVMCGTFGASSDASALIQELRNAGFAPVFTRDSGEEIELLVGKCETLLDAVLLRERLEKAGFKPGTLITLEATEAASQAEPAKFGRPLIIRPESPHARAAVAFDPTLRSDTRTIQESLQAGSDDAITTDGLTLYERLPDSDPAKGWLAVEAAQLKVSINRKAAQSLQAFLDVGRGDIAASPADRRRARLLAANSYHYYYFNPLRAYQAYREILAEHYDDPATRARVLVEIAATHLELTRREKSTFEETRAAALRVRRDVPPEFARAHAAADLIYCETFLYAGEKERALQEFEGFAERHPGRTREISMANLNQGILHGELKNWEKCREFLEQNLHLDYSDPEENFYWVGTRWNMKQKAADQLQFFARQFGDDAVFNDIEAYLAAGSQNDDMPNDQQTFNTAFPHSLYERTFEK